MPSTVFQLKDLSPAVATPAQAEVHVVSTDAASPGDVGAVVQAMTDTVLARVP